MKAKAKDPSIGKDEATAADEGGAEIEHPEKSNPPNSDDMNAEELAAFKKIMGEIEGQEKEKLNGTTMGSEVAEKDEQALNEAEVAELNEVVDTVDHQDATAAEIAESADEETPEPEGGDDEGLSQDQQKAFDSIMAQIEGDGTAEAGADSGHQMGAAVDTEPADDFSAELEKVVLEADAAEESGQAQAQGDASGEGLDEDQQKAFENILAQIEGRGTTDAEVGTVKEITDAMDVEPVEDPPFIIEPGPLNGGMSGNTLDISDDIEDILKEIISSDDESTLPETAADEAVGEPAADDASKKAFLDDDIVAHMVEDGDPVTEDSPQPSPSPATHGQPAGLDEKPATKDQSDSQPADQKPKPDPLPTSPKVTPLREANQSAQGRNGKAILASVVVVLFLGLAAYFYWVRDGRLGATAPNPVTNPTHTDVVEATESLPQPQESAAVVHRPSDQSRLKMAAEQLDRLRNELLEKQAAVEELRNYYQAGIDEEIQGIVDTVRKAGKGMPPFAVAIADPRISLGLSAIQRRDTYIRKLATPVRTLFWNSEELLFFSRKAALLSLMAANTSDIDIDGFMKQADQIRDGHASALAQLNIDAIPGAPTALESIWLDIAKRLPETPRLPEKKPTTIETDNAAIWNNFCDGDFTQKHKLTELSTEAARCLAAWKGKDLFLNGLSDLSPAAARQLADWEGDWLGLNGLKELSPEVAVHLSRWKGKGLSLNGLSRLSPRVVAILSEWQGDQIEIVKVKFMAHWENPKTRLFLSEDLQRKQNATRK